jgi:parallel beta-helix repeat protein
MITGPGSGVGITDGGSCSPICQYNIIIANGTIKGFLEGILLDYTEYATVSNMNVTENTFGIAVEQDHAVVTGSWANNNGSIGIFLEDDDETVSNSQANNNSIIGIYLDGANTTVSNSQANNNRVKAYPSASGDAIRSGAAGRGHGRT